jgi:hypothetical protein
MRQKCGSGSFSGSNSRHPKVAATTTPIAFLDAYFLFMEFPLLPGSKTLDWLVI